MDANEIADANRRIIIAANAVLTGICTLFISAMLTLGPKALTQGLRDALLAFSVALPVFVMALAFSFLRQTVAFAYFAMSIGFVAVIFAIWNVLHYLDPRAAIGFIIAVGGCSLEIIIAANIARRTLR